MTDNPASKLARRIAEEQVPLYPTGHHSCDTFEHIRENVQTAIESEFGPILLKARMNEIEQCAVEAGELARSGRLVRSLHCERCGLICKTQAHHRNYEEPLIVRWLCPFCHKKEHSLSPPGLESEVDAK
jgi:hypothetical protein